MARLLILSGEQVCTILTKNGFSKVHQRGSHIIMQKATASTTITVPVPNHKEIKIGTLQSIIRQSGVLRSAFEN